METLRYLPEKNIVINMRYVKAVKIIKYPQVWKVEIRISDGDTYRYTFDYEREAQAVLSYLHKGWSE
jgi:hypothetical protein